MWEGTAGVRVSIVCFEPQSKSNVIRLNGRIVENINADLTSGTVGRNLSKIRRLKEMSGLSFMGITKSGPFELTGSRARQLLKSVGNPNGRANSEVLKRSVNGNEVSGRLTDRWILDFGNRTEEEVSQFEEPYKYAETFIKPVRLKSRTSKNREYWWRFERYRPEMNSALAELNRYIATPMVSKNRIFVWLDVNFIPENGVIVIAREDNVSFGILQSKIHYVWTKFLGSTHIETRRYTPTTTFETFPFPVGLTPNVNPTTFANDSRAIKIDNAVKKLCEQRDRWLYSKDLVKFESEHIDGYPPRIVPKSRSVESIVKKKTLNYLYNSYPRWLELCHQDLDTAVAEAYGWSTDFLNGKLTDKEIFHRLLELNNDRN